MTVAVRCVCGDCFELDGETTVGVVGGGRGFVVRGDRHACRVLELAKRPDVQVAAAGVGLTPLELAADVVAGDCAHPTCAEGAPCAALARHEREGLDLEALELTRRRLAAGGVLKSAAGELVGERVRDEGAGPLAMLSPRWAFEPLPADVARLEVEFPRGLIRLEPRDELGAASDAAVADQVAAAAALHRAEMRALRLGAASPVDYAAMALVSLAGLGLVGWLAYAAAAAVLSVVAWVAP
ncbi:MAG: hypothetical protein DCC71_15415 [Proteobacteria bacterium]|nr:MAG: hypothetical protein DCC71_15415 [Pseudomonadota bacterium]